MTTVRELIVEWGFEVDEAALDSAERGIEGLKTSLIAVAGFAAAAGAAIFAFAQQSAEALNEVKDLSFQVGISVESMQKLGFAAAQTGNDQQKLAQALGLVSERAGEAAKEGSPFAEIFSRLGTAVKDASGNLRAADDIFIDLADGFNGITSATERAALAAKLFGGGNISLLQTLAEGSDGLRELGKEAENLGLVFGQDAVDKGTEFNDTLRSMMFVLKAVRTEIGLELIPMMINLFKSTQELIIANKDFIKEKVVFFLKETAEFVKRAAFTVRALARAFGEVRKRIGALLPDFLTLERVIKGLGLAGALFLLGKMTIALAQLSKGVLGLGKAIGIAQLKALLLPIALGVLVAGLLLAIDDFVAFLQGRDSIIGLFFEDKDDLIESFFSFLEKIKEGIVDFAKTAAQFVFEFFGVAPDQASLAADKVAGIIRGLLDILTILFSGAFNAIKTGITSIVQFFALAFTDPVKAISEFGKFVGKLIKDLLGNVVETFTKIGQFIGEAFGIDPEKVASGMEAFKSAAMSVVEFIGDFVTHTIETLFRGLAGVFETLKDIVSGVVQTVVDLFTLDLGTVGDKLLGRFKEVGSFLGEALSFGGSLLGASQDTGLDTAPVLAPQALGAAPAPINNSSSQVIELKPNINVEVPAGSDANGIADAVSRAVQDTMQKEARQTFTQIRRVNEY